MRTEDDGVELKIILQDCGEIARVLLAFTRYNKSLYSTSDGQCKIPRHILNMLEESLES